MKLINVVFVFLAFTIFKSMVLAETQPDAITFPSMDFPDLEFETIPDGCSGFTDCIEYVGKVIVNLVLGIVYVVLLLFNLIAFIAALFVTVGEVTVTGIDNAPWWVNLIVFTPYLGIVGVILYKMIRKGDASDG